MRMGSIVLNSQNSFELFSSNEFCFGVINCECIVCWFLSFVMGSFFNIFFGSQNFISINLFFMLLDQVFLGQFLVNFVEVLIFLEGLGFGIFNILDMLYSIMLLGIVDGFFYLIVCDIMGWLVYLG